MPCPGPEDDELSIRARAKEARAARASVMAVITCTGVGGMIESASRDPFFEFDILRVDVARWLDIGQRGARRCGRPG